MSVRKFRRAPSVARRPPNKLFHWTANLTRRPPLRASISLSPFAPPSRPLHAASESHVGRVLTYSVTFSVAALFGVAIFYFVLELLPGNGSSQYLFLNWIAVSAVASAFSSTVLVQRIGWWPRADTDFRTGALRGSLVVCVSHSLFGVYFIACAEIDSLLDNQISSFSFWPTVHSMLVSSIASLMALPATLIAGCLAGIYAEKSYTK